MNDRNKKRPYRDCKLDVLLVWIPETLLVVKERSSMHLRAGFGPCDLETVHGACGTFSVGFGNSAILSRTYKLRDVDLVPS
jgi:hypothetical protein